MHTYHIHIEGQVQGVGFRPFVFLLARELGLCGWVNNGVDGVHIGINAEPRQALAFYQALVERAPRLARITAHHMREVAAGQYDTFEIVHSEAAGEPNLLLTPDVALCANCRAELLDPADRRFGYPFITCTNCGPRYSIVEALPYDRERTTMRPFAMCPACAAEYDDPLDRRYYSQTNSCAACGIRLTLLDTGGAVLSEENGEAMALTAAAIREGLIVAVKGIGGYLLVCDATDAGAVRRLRARKARPAKPFALMYPGLDTLAGDVFLPPSAREVLTGPAAPIVLLPLRPAPASGICTGEIAPGLDQVGAMLPYAPLYELLLRAVGRPVVATSGNVSHSPIVFEDEQALRDLAPLADRLLLNDRRIALPQDDSVLRFTPYSSTPIVIRRSRGLAPTYIQPDLALPDACILAMGAELKSTFTLLHRRNTFISQYLGDLVSYDTQRHFRHTLDHFLRLFETRPGLVLVDRHPDYFATRLGEELAHQWNVPLRRVQHHQAHFAAVLAENRLHDQRGPVLGVIWDGTGLGDDGQIWGGEFFRYQTGAFTRVGQLTYFDYLLGDKMAREPRLSALSVARELPELEARLRPKFTDTEWNVYQRRLARPAALRTSSMGRLFDAVASLLGLMDVATYEGEAAMRLEQLAGRFFRQNGLPAADAYPLDAVMPGSNIEGSVLVGLMNDDLKQGTAPARVAARFHRTLAETVRRQVYRTGIGDVCCSGGVFQNEILVDLIRHILGKDVNLYFHQQLSPNDEGVSFGQLVWHLISEPPEGEATVVGLAGE